MGESHKDSHFMRNKLNVLALCYTFFRAKRNPVYTGQCILFHRSEQEGIKQHRNILVQTHTTILCGCDF